MSLFRKTQPPELAPGRRRPAAAQPEARPQAFSYYAQRPGQPGGRERQAVEAVQMDVRPARAALVGRNRWTIIAGGTVLTLIFLYSLALSPTPKIVTVTNSGNQYFIRDPSVYQQAAQRSLSSSFLNRSKLTVDTGHVVSDMTNTFPELATVEVGLPLIGQQPVIKVAPYQPAFIVTTGQSTAYLLDTTGRAMVPSSQLSDKGQLSFATVRDPGTGSAKLGTQTLPQPTVGFIQEVLVLLDAAHVAHGDLTLPPGTSEFDVAISGKPYFVKFNLQGDAKLQTGTFLAAKQRLEHDHTGVGEYVDVRVPERAYYK